MSEAYAPAERWRCERCGAAGDLSIPPLTYGVDTQALAARAHAAANLECAQEWGGEFVRMSQPGEYPD